MFKPNEPPPVPVFAVTVQVVPEPLTFVMVGPFRKVFARLKLLALKPLTESAKVTVQLTLAALHAKFPPTVLMEDTSGIA